MKKPTNDVERKILNISLGQYIINENPKLTNFQVYKKLSNNVQIYDMENVHTGDPALYLADPRWIADKIDALYLDINKTLCPQ